MNLSPDILNLSPTDATKIIDNFARRQALQRKVLQSRSFLVLLGPYHCSICLTKCASHLRFSQGHTVITSGGLGYFWHSFFMETGTIFHLDYLASGIGTICLLCYDNLAPNFFLLLMGIHIPWHLGPIVFSLLCFGHLECSSSASNFVFGWVLQFGVGVRLPRSHTPLSLSPN